MRVLLISPTPPPVGGISRWSEIVLNHFYNNKDVELIHTNSSPLYQGKITYLKRVLFGIIGLFSILKSVNRELKKEVDVVHITTSGSMALFRDRLIINLAKKYKAKTVIHLHFGRLPKIACLKNREWIRFDKIFDSCDAVIAIDKDTENVLKNQGYEEKTYFCPNPIDVAETNKLDTGDERKKKIVFVGHIYESKGVRELVEAWISIEKQFPDYVLELVGSTVQTEFVASLPQDGSICYAGQKTHIETMKLLSEATIMVLPSYSEGFPNVILEAMALKTPIIATNVGAIPEMLDDECGVLVAPKDTGALKNALFVFLSNSDLRKEMADKAFARVTKHYDINIVIKNYKDIWEKLTG